MATSLQSLWQHARNTVSASEARRIAIEDLVNEILKFRKISRPRGREALQGIYLEIFEVAQQELHILLEERLERQTVTLLQEDEARGLQNQALKLLLTPERLQQLALATQQCEPRTKAWQYAIHDLTEAILLAGNLSRPPGITQAIYQESVNRTLDWVCRRIHTYDPQRAPLMVWVNYRLRKMVWQIQQEQRDTYTQSTQSKILRLKSQISGIVKRMNQETIHHWLACHFKRLIPDRHLSFNMIGLLGMMWGLGMLLKEQPEIGKDLLFAMAQTTIVTPRLVSLHEESQQIDEIAQSEVETPLIDYVRQYFEVDPEGLCQKHIRHHPQATIQRICLSRMDNIPWQTLSDQLGIGIPALSNFYQRNLSNLAPKIRQFVQEQYP